MAAKSVEVTEEEEEVVVVEDAGVVVFFLVGFNGTEEVVGLCFGIDLDFLVAFFLGTGFGLVGFADLSDSFAFLLLRVSICFSRARVCVSLCCCLLNKKSVSRLYWNYCNSVSAT